MGDSDSRGFFKVFTPNSELRMKIPTAYTEYKNGKLPETTVLRDRYGNIWPIGLAKFGQDLYFEDGWNRFIKDNNVEFGDVFIFDYKGNSVFDFTLLGDTECEKRGVGRLRLVKEEEEEEVSERQKSEKPIDLNNLPIESSSSSNSVL